MGNPEINTPYDDVFRTLLIDCTSLIIPVVNEIFGENYSGDERIISFHNEYFMKQQDANTKEKITDSCFEIGGDRKKYHIECQSTADNSMLIRMFEYDSQIALEDGDIVGGKLTVTFPHSGVLYLRHKAHTPDTLTIEINTPDGSIAYNVPVLKLQTYTIDEIFEKNLLFLIPFHIFCYEKDMKKHAKDDAWIKALKLRYLEIRKRLDEMCMNGRISEYVKCALIDMTKKVNTNIATKYDKIKEGVNTAMGGKVLDYEAKTILNTGIRQGREEGLEAGRLEGLEIGRQEGLEAGRQEGLEAGRLETVLELCRDGVIDISEAAHRLNMDDEELKKYL
jgi:hypothetical protein